MINTCRTSRGRRGFSSSADHFSSTLLNDTRSASSEREQPVREAELAEINYRRTDHEPAAQGKECRMTERVRQGEVIDSKKINKHLTDIVQLSALLQPGQVIELPAKLRADLQAFARAVVALNLPDQLQAMNRVAAAYAFDL